MSRIHMIHVERGCERGTLDATPGEPVSGGASHPGSFWFIRGATENAKAAKRSWEWKKSDTWEIFV